MFETPEADRDVIRARLQPGKLLPPEAGRLLDALKVASMSQSDMPHGRLALKCGASVAKRLNELPDLGHTWELLQRDLYQHDIEFDGGRDQRFRPKKPKVLEWKRQCGKAPDERTLGAITYLGSISDKLTMIAKQLSTSVKLSGALPGRFASQNAMPQPAAAHRDHVAGAPQVVNSNVNGQNLPEIAQLNGRTVELVDRLTKANVACGGSADAGNAWRRLQEVAGTASPARIEHALKDIEAKVKAKTMAGMPITKLPAYVANVNEFQAAKTKPAARDYGGEAPLNIAKLSRGITGTYVPPPNVPPTWVPPGPLVPPPPFTPKSRRGQV